MKLEITKENIIKKAKEYGFEVTFDSERETGFYIGDKKVNIDDLFGEIIPELKELK